MIVIEAAAAGTPSVVVRGEDNAATELIEDGVNGFVAPSASAEDLAEAIGRALDGGMELRRSTAAWFADNAQRLSLEVVARASSECLPLVGGKPAVAKDPGLVVELGVERLRGIVGRVLHLEVGGTDAAQQLGL